MAAPQQKRIIAQVSKLVGERKTIMAKQSPKAVEKAVQKAAPTKKVAPASKAAPQPVAVKPTVKKKK